MANFIEILNSFLFIVGLAFAYTFTRSKMDKRGEEKEPEKPKETKVEREPVVQKYDSVFVPKQTRRQLVCEIYRYAVENNIESDELRKLLIDNETEIRVEQDAMKLHPRIYLESKYGSYFLGRNGLINMDILHRQMEEGLVTAGEIRKLMDFDL